MSNFNQIFSQNVANDDAQNIVNIVKRAEAWFGIAAAMERDPETRELTGALIVFGAAHALERLEDMLDALGYTGEAVRAHMKRSELFSDGGSGVVLRIDVEAIAELYA